MASDPIDQLTGFLKQVFDDTRIKNGVIAVSGGIDSAVSLTLLTRALGPKNVFPLLLPYRNQSIADSQAICAWNQIPQSNWKIFDIGPLVDSLVAQLQIPDSDRVRRGNIMARVRMIVVYDHAKATKGLVCGTENKSEKYLGYFTRFGDSASDIEPLERLFKHEVRMLAQALGLPNRFLTKAPSAGLWSEQTDETELGFSYDDADQVITEYLGEAKLDPRISETIRAKILQRIAAEHFKQVVPYTLTP